MGLGKGCVQVSFQAVVSNVWCYECYGILYVGGIRVYSLFRVCFLFIISFVQFDILCTQSHSNKMQRYKLFRIFAVNFPLFSFGIFP